MLHCDPLNDATISVVTGSLSLASMMENARDSTNIHFILYIVLFFVDLVSLSVLILSVLIKVFCCFLSQVASYPC